MIDSNSSDGYLPQIFDQSLGDLTIETTESLKEGLKGTYSFLSNKIKVSDDDPATTLHEKTHADNIEALLEEPEEVREKAVEAEELPDSYVETFDRLGVAEADYSLASGITFHRFEQKHGFDISEKSSLVKNIFSSATENIVKEVVEDFGLDNFDVRDEAIAQTVEAYEQGILDNESFFHERIENVKESYSNLKGYRENAGEMIAEEMQNLRSFYRSKGGKEKGIESLMDIRPDYLRGDL